MCRGIVALCINIQIRKLAEKQRCNGILMPMPMPKTYAHAYAYAYAYTYASSSYSFKDLK